MKWENPMYGGRRSMYAPYDTRTTRNIWMRFVLFWTGCSRHAVSLIRVTKDCRIFRLSNAIMELPIAVQHWHLNETSQYPIDRTLDNSDIYIYIVYHAYCGNMSNMIIFSN